MIKIRPGIPDDIKRILIMRKEFYSIDQYPFDIKEQEKLTAEFILNPSLGIVYIISREEQIIGYVCLTFGYSFEYGGKTAFVDELYLEPDHRSQGYGSQVMDYVIAKGHELKISTLHLEAEMHNEKANQLYIKKGFKNTKRYLLFNRLN